MEMQLVQVCSKTGPCSKRKHLPLQFLNQYFCVMQKPVLVIKLGTAVISDGKSVSSAVIKKWLPK